MELPYSTLKQDAALMPNLLAIYSDFQLEAFPCSLIVRVNELVLSHVATSPFRHELLQYVLDAIARSDLQPASMPFFERLLWLASLPNSPLPKLLVQSAHLERRQLRLIKLALQHYHCRLFSLLQSQQPLAAMELDRLHCFLLMLSPFGTSRFVHVSVGAAHGSLGGRSNR